GLNDVWRRTKTARGRPRVAVASARVADRRAFHRVVAEARAGSDGTAARAGRRRDDSAYGRAKRSNGTQILEPRAGAGNGPPGARPPGERAAEGSRPQPPVPGRPCAT